VAVVVLQVVLTVVVQVAGPMEEMVEMPLGMVLVVVACQLFIEEQPLLL
jgi:hypothetical protein